MLCVSGRGLLLNTATTLATISAESGSKDAVHFGEEMNKTQQIFLFPCSNKRGKSFWC